VSERGILILGASEVSAALDGRELQIITAVSQAYVSHYRGQSDLPHSVFLRFGEDNPNRIIGLPAYLADEDPIAGLKWIASFPGNTAQGIDRASAVLVLNSLSTGRPLALMESSIISAKRTAAGAALAARTLHGDRRERRVGLIGCGLINFEVLRFLHSSFPALEEVALCDLDPRAIERFTRRVERELPGLRCEPCPSAEALISGSRLVSLATVAGSPHIHTLPGLSPDSTILHLSLRDLAPAVIRAADNVVDDIDHVLRARTSLHLTQLEDGNHDFVRCPLAEVLSNEAPARTNRPLIFSPFGLGVLDLAVARLVLDHARGTGMGVEVHGFLPASRAERLECRKLDSLADPAPLLRFADEYGANEHSTHFQGLATGTTEVWTTVLDGELVGLACLRRGSTGLAARIDGIDDIDGINRDTTAELVECIVHPDHRGLDVRVALIESVRNHALDRLQLATIHCTVDAGDDESRRALETSGFVELETFDDERHARRTTTLFVHRGPAR